MVTALAIILLIFCIWDTVRPTYKLHRSLRETGQTWWQFRKRKELHRYALAFSMNIVAIIFFGLYLYGR